ncbi:serine/threonine protein kinase [Stieleria sp. JC731]|uniref:serine/threonine-protein kinase n=1 Tax=Stieleria sp. JC731 TaxID=2894195 RepID=UPI001E58D957|nr:serine/threonine-protein kinase [Stieleria sp. JC731]MCC9599553.1 serine/threonine protein kinase [Stieleria sp. JC731]
MDSFLAGQLSDSEIETWERHLEQCFQCRSKLDDRSAIQGFWADTKRFLGSVDETLAIDSNRNETESFAGQGREVTSLLDPTDHPDMLGRFAGYEVSGVIGRGGMGIVMKARDMSLDRLVAIKVLDPSYSGLSASRQRFAREAKSAAAVVHENVIGIFGVDEFNGVPYLVMPYIKGESLQQRIDRQAPLPVEDMLEISVQVARGLTAAHGQGVIHRDIKPSNILLLNGVSRVLITDFGLARTVDDVSLTRSGILAGTPQYMSPEQASSEAVDPRTDLFSLGSVMYAMACGHPPFRSESPYGVLKKIIDQPHRSLLQHRSDLPSWYIAIVDRLLSKRPVDRFDSAAEVAELLEEGLSHLRQPTTIQKPFVRSVRQSVFWSRRKVIIGIVLAISGACCFAAFLSAPQNRPSSLTDEKNVAETGEADNRLPRQVESRAEDGLDWRFDDRLLSDLERELDELLNETAE